MSGRVLVTGDRGLVGTSVARRLTRSGWEVVGFDARDGADVLRAKGLKAAVADCDAVVHLAAVASDHDDPERIMNVNVIGTANLLLACAQARVRRVVFMSSAQALGVFAGHRRPDYLPIDDAHPTYAARPYALSKRIGEELCARFSAETAIPTLCLRPPLVLDAQRRAFLHEQLCQRGDEEHDPAWEYGAFLDVEDLADAVSASLEVALPAHRRLLLCAADVCDVTGRTSVELARRLAPEVPWRGGREYERDPLRALVDCCAARALLGWEPRRAWRGPPPRQDGAA